jgi:tungstate transport system substrate-binding protein
MRKSHVLSVMLSLVLVGLMTLSLSAETRLRLATTTSTENSGLLNVLIPPFEKANNCKVDVVAVGTGKALKLGERGDADVVMVHARAAEDKFVEQGFGIYRRDLMHNDFVIIGPAKDPAGIKGTANAIETFKKIALGKAPFISRGDNSGTNKKEKYIWKEAGIKPEGKWYIEAGQGMGAVLRMADEKKAYTLSDRGTFIAFEDKIDLVILSEGDQILYNPYGVIAVNPKKNPGVKFKLAEKFIDYLTGPKGQKIIGSYKLKGKQLFFPDVMK